MGKLSIIDDVVEILRQQGREMHVVEIQHLLGVDNRNAVSQALNYRLETLPVNQLDIERVRRGVWQYKEPEVQAPPRSTPRQRPVPAVEAKSQMPTLLEVLGSTEGDGLNRAGLIARDPDTGKIYKATLM